MMKLSDLDRVLRLSHERKALIDLHKEAQEQGSLFDDAVTDLIDLTEVRLMIMGLCTEAVGVKDKELFDLGVSVI